MSCYDVCRQFYMNDDKSFPNSNNRFSKNTIFYKLDYSSSTKDTTPSLHTFKCKSSPYGSVLNIHDHNFVHDSYSFTKRSTLKPFTSSFVLPLSNYP